MESVITTEGTSTSSATVRPTQISLEILEYYFNFPAFLKAGLLLLFILTFVLNVLVGRALYRARRLKPVLRVLLFNLALGDALAGLVNVYHLVAAILYNTFSVECIIRYGLVIELMSVTLFFIVLLSVDRVVALVAALRYEQLITTRRLWLASGLVWTFSLAFPLAGLAGVDPATRHCVFQLFLPHYSLVLYGVGCLLTIGLIVGLNLFTLTMTLRHIRHIAATVVGDSREDRVAAMNHKAAVTSLAIVVPFLVLCSPQYVLFLLFAVDPGLKETLAGLVAISVGLGLVVGNSFLNPFIYVWRSTEVRQEVRRTFCLR